MMKCPFCGFDNEDGALFCEQCKSDLSSVPIPMVVPDAPVEAIPMAAVVEEPIPMAAVVEPSSSEITLPMAGLVEPAASPAPAPAATETPTGTPFAPGATPKLAVIRGQKIGLEFPIYPDLNFVGRADEKPVDIDLEDQEPPDRVWCSRQHAVLHWDETQGQLTIEDLNSANGTFVNRARIHPGQKRQLFLNDVIQIGTVHLKLKV